MALPALSEPGGAEKNALRVRVEGMDCGACGIKVENALKRLPGVSDIRMNYSTKTPLLRLDENRTSRETVHGKIRALGYTPKLVNGAVLVGQTTPHEPAAGDESWWKTR